MIHAPTQLTYGEICAGIGGFGLGFERAGWRGEWAIELDDVNRAVLADRFSGLLLEKDLRFWRSYAQRLSRVDAILCGFPCQDISKMSQRSGPVRGLAGNRSGLIHEILEIIGHFQPDGLVFENVPNLLSSNDGKDLEFLIRALAERNYLGFARVLDAQYFGVPQKRRRLYLVACLGRHPSMEFLADAAPVEALPCSIQSHPRAHGDAWAGYTLTAPDKFSGAAARINITSELLVAEENGWGSMVERARASQLSGVSAGLDATNAEEAYAAGNAVCPAVAEWIAGILSRS